MRLTTNLRTLREVSLSAVVVKLEEGGTTFHRGLDHVRRSDLNHATLVELVAERAKEHGTEVHDRSSSLPAELEVAQVSAERRLGVLCVRLIAAATYLAKHTLESLVSSRCAADNAPPVNLDLDTVGSLLTFLHLVDRADDLDSALDGEIEGVNGLRAGTGEEALHEAGTVTENDKGLGLLGTKAVDPAKSADASVGRGRKGVNLGLRKSASFLTRTR